jgi:hypothetical protein
MHIFRFPVTLDIISCTFSAVCYHTCDNSKKRNYTSFHAHFQRFAVTPVTISKKGNYMSSGAHFSGHSEYTSPIIYGFPLIEKKARYLKKRGGVEKNSQTVIFSSHLMQNCLAIQDMLAP